MKLFYKRKAKLTFSIDQEEGFPSIRFYLDVCDKQELFPINKNYSYSYHFLQFIGLKNLEKYISLESPGLSTD